MCNFRVLVTFLGLIGVLTPSMHSLIKIFGDNLLMLDNLQFTLPILSSLIQIIIFWWKKEGITFFIHSNCTNYKHDRKGLVKVKERSRQKYDDPKSADCTYNFYLLLLLHGIPVFLHRSTAGFWNINETDSQHYGSRKTNAFTNSLYL
ncbi:PREDICTED: uncharacterized protein LOC105461786 [Wasmannia auropunctata]|uniref:uncharacterized protein LOC105461786 n=1 Tax=Wasmannia auropunctata TaxID=64793 RepID=UPI0005F08A09|nr:PREDICTED: uncharacterized protein LOC105461786 [Wasmannia auropunctata]